MCSWNSFTVSACVVRLDKWSIRLAFYVGIEIVYTVAIASHMKFTLKRKWFSSWCARHGALNSSSFHSLFGQRQTIRLDLFQSDGVSMGAILVCLQCIVRQLRMAKWCAHLLRTTRIIAIILNTFTEIKSAINNRTIEQVDVRSTNRRYAFSTFYHRRVASRDNFMRWHQSHTYRPIPTVVVWNDEVHVIASFYTNSLHVRNASPHGGHFSVVF